MPRPLKKRFVCKAPENNVFLPHNVCDAETITMSIDEYEVVRLLDLENHTQESAAAQMHVSRTTVQEIYNRARTKLADALVNTKKLIIDGGNYISCDKYSKKCGKGCKATCHKHRCAEN